MNYEKRFSEEEIDAAANAANSPFVGAVEFSYKAILRQVLAERDEARQAARSQANAVEALRPDWGKVVFSWEREK